METFEQRWFFDSRKYVIKENGLEVSSTAINNSAQIFLKFEQLGFIKSAINKGNRYWLIGIAFSILGILVTTFKPKQSISVSILRYYLFYPCILLVCVLGYLITHKKRYIFSNYESNGRIDFLTDPEKDLKLKDFLEEAKRKRDAFLLANYGEINKNLPYQVQYARFVWLKNNDVISADELKKKIQELDHSLNMPNKVVGFGQKD